MYFQIKLKYHYSKPIKLQIACSSSAAKNFPQTQTSEPASRLGCYMWQTLAFCNGKNNEMAQQQIIDK